MSLIAPNRKQTEKMSECMGVCMYVNMCDKVIVYVVHINYSSCRQAEASCKAVLDYKATRMSLKIACLR